MSAPTSIRRLNAKDDSLYDGMLNLFSAAFEDAECYSDSRPGLGWRRRLLSSDHFVALVALDDDHVVGALAGYELIKFEQERSEFYIYDLAVAESHRRRRIATRLIDTFRRIAMERGGSVVFVQAHQDDAPAIALYETLGARQEVLHFDIPAEGTDRTKAPE